MALLFNRLFCVAALVFAGIALPANADCELTNQALESMLMVDVELVAKDKSVTKIKARLADNSETRAAGFQRVCASVIEQAPILFLYKHLTKPSFHMNNVVAPIDIAFIKQSGKIDTIQSMKPYFLGSLRKPLYTPDAPIIAALEASPGFFKQWQAEQLTIRWVDSVKLVNQKSE